MAIIGSLVLMVPAAHHTSVGSAVQPAFFTAVSAVTVTGLTTVDTSAFWTPFGQGVILALIEIGGIGIMTIATLLGLLVGGRLGLRTRLVAQAEMHVINIGEVRPLLRRVIVTMASFQAVLAVILTLRFRAAYFEDWQTSLWHGVFYAISSFNNAGFALEGDSLVKYVGDAMVIFPLSIAVYAGAVGFPVMAELFQGWRRPSRWTIHTRLTVWGSAALFLAGTVAFLAVEWNNPGTMGSMGWWHKIVTSIEAGVMPRSGGFNSVDYANIKPESLGIGTIMMFIGGGSASTAGGIKVTTFLLLAFVILAELRGDPEVMVGRRSINSETLRQALTIALVAVMLVAVATLTVLSMTDFAFDQVLFEVTSAFGTVGLSTGITSDLPVNAQWVLMALMFIGRVGTITAASALTMRQRTPRYHLPEERPIIG